MTIAPFTPSLPDTVLYASDDSPESITEAREYITEKGLTKDTARLIRKDGQVMVLAKDRVWV